MRSSLRGNIHAYGSTGAGGRAGRRTFGLFNWMVGRWCNITAVVKLVADVKRRRPVDDLHGTSIQQLST